MQGKKEFYITDADKEWVTQNFEWLIKSYGYPSDDFEPILFIDKFFPHSIGNVHSAIEPLIKDLCVLFKMDSSKISFYIEEDIRDSHETPYEMQGMPFECDLEIIKTDKGYNYKLIFAKSILKNPKRLVFNSVFYFIQIHLSEKAVNWVQNEEHYFIFYLIGIFTGWGVILAQTMIDTGRQNEGLWERKWRYISPMPMPVMAYGLALHSSLIEKTNPGWKNFLPADIRAQYEAAVDYINQYSNPIFNKQELIAKSLLKEARELNTQKKFDQAIETYQKILFLTQDNSVKALIYNNIGYAHLWKAEYLKSIDNFQKALEVNPNFGYANDNLGFAFIMIGDLDTAKHYLSIAMQSKKNNLAYSYRNMAIYYQKKGDVKKAHEYFKKSFENINMPVDWLEYFYAKFLDEQGEKEKSLTYLQIAVNKGEPLAIQWMNEIKNTF